MRNQETLISNDLSVTLNRCAATLETFPVDSTKILSGITDWKKFLSIRVNEVENGDNIALGIPEIHHSIWVIKSATRNQLI